MNTDNTQDAAEPSLASAGSHVVAWSVFDGPDRMHLARDYGEAESCADDIGGQIVPLYRSPTLTDAEREAVGLAAGDYLYHQDPGGRAQHIRQTLLGLLERTR